MQQHLSAVTGQNLTGLSLKPLTTSGQQLVKLSGILQSRETEFDEYIKVVRQEVSNPSRRLHVQFLMVPKLLLRLGLEGATHSCFLIWQALDGAVGTDSHLFLPALCVATCPHPQSGLVN